MSETDKNGDEINNDEMNCARNRVYQLLSSLFAREIDQALVSEFSSKQAQDFWHQLATQPEFIEPVNLIMEVIAGLTTNDDLLELAADFCGLFLVGTKHSASPYASLYMGNKDATLFGPQHQKMVSFLEENKLQLQSDFAEPADHVAVILAYAGHLVINASDKNQLSYLQNYLASWLGNFVAQVESVDQGRFYSALARLTLAWVNLEIEWLDSPSF